MTINLCFIKEEYFMQHSTFTNMLDPGNLNKQNHRTHLCLVVESDANKFYIPLRNNLGAEVRKFGRIGHAVPSKNRPSAGLDYRYALIINDDIFIEEQTEQRIPNMQYQKIEAEYEIIKREFDTYLRGFKRAMIKNRIQKEPLYRVSSLIYFLDELKA